MGLLKIEGVTHWSIPVNSLDESEKFYGDLLGLKHLGRLGNSGMSCFNVGDHNILLCERSKEVDKAHVEERNVHHSFTVAPETIPQACKIFKEKNVKVDELYYRKAGYFPGRELYFSIRAEIVWSCAIRLGRRGCRSRRSKNWPSLDGSLRSNRSSRSKRSSCSGFSGSSQIVETTFNGWNG